MKRIRTILISMVAVFGLAAPLAIPAVASAQANNPAQEPKADIEGGLSCGANLSFGDGCKEDTKGAADDVDNLVTNVVDVLSLVVGTVAVIMIIIGGLQYVLSGGDSGKVGNSKNTILYAVVGLVVVALAQVIVRFTVQSTKSA
jgi:hypothetical protein